MGIEVKILSYTNVGEQVAQIVFQIYFVLGFVGNFYKVQKDRNGDLRNLQLGMFFFDRKSIDRRFQVFRDLENDRFLVFFEINNWVMKSS